MACNLLHRCEIKENKILKVSTSICIYHDELGLTKSDIINIAFLVFAPCKGLDLLNMWHGNTKGNVRNLFSEAISDARSMVKTINLREIYFTFC